LLRPLLLIVSCVAMLFFAIARAPSASADCAYNPNALSIRQMIVQGTTGNDRINVLLLGRVSALRDLRGDKGGDTIAKLRVREHPVGLAPDRSNVRFWKPPPGESLSPNFEFHRGQHYAVVAHRRDSGVFIFSVCEQTRELSRQRMWRLIHLFRHG
jgi:hypothetical protein